MKNVTYRQMALVGLVVFAILAVIVFVTGSRKQAVGGDTTAFYLQKQTQLLQEIAGDMRCLRVRAGGGAC